MHTSATAPSIDQAKLVRESGGVGTWELDAERSSIGFGVKNFWGLMTVRGTFTDAVGHAQVGADGSITGRLEIASASVFTGNEKRDTHLRSKDFFDVDHFPTMTVAIDRVEMTGPVEGVADGRITILGETRPIRFGVRVSTGADGDVATVTASLVVDRASFGMTWAPMGMASKQVAVETSLRFGKQAA